MRTGGKKDDERDKKDCQYDRALRSADRSGLHHDLSADLDGWGYL